MGSREKGTVAGVGFQDLCPPDLLLFKLHQSLIGIFQSELLNLRDYGNPGRLLKGDRIFFQVGNS